MSRGKLKSQLRLVRCSPFAAVAVAVLLLMDPAVSARAQAARNQSLASAALESQSPAAQTLEAMEAAGVKMAFDVASVKPNKSNDRPYSNVPLVPGLVPPPSGSLFSATNYPAIFYVAFAYNLTTDEALHLLPHLPGWVITDKFDIQARADGSPTLDQMRLMMQSLLADRFKLAVHTDTKPGPVYALVLAKPGKTGPQLQQETEPCSTSTNPVDSGASPSGTASAAVTPASPSSKSGLQLPPIPCGSFSVLPASVPGRIRLGARSVAIGLIANLLPGVSFGAGAPLDRPVLDQTGLSGMFDFTIEFSRESNAALPPGADSQADTSGPTLLEAMKDQLGLKLEPTTGPVSVFVIDHVEQPSPN